MGSTNFTKEEAKQERQWAEDKKYHAARSVWIKQRHMTPKRRITWARWFERMFGEPLEQYAQRMADKKRK